MPLRLDIKKELSARSERVKCCDFHPQEPWILAALYSGHVFIWNYQTQSMVKSLEVCDLPVRSAKFVPRMQWIVCGTDDMHVRVYNYNTMECVQAYEAHTDYIRSIAVHPTLPYILTASDDMTIKLWDWDKQFKCREVFEGHTHYVMQVEFNPKDTNTFASASLDRTVRVWGLNSPSPHYSLEGHERGVNCVGYFRGGDRPYLVSGADDHLVKIWDYQTKTCVATLEGHTNNVSAVQFHPELPIILTGSEDGTVRIWHSGTYRLENTLNYQMERVWSVACLRGSNKVALGFDDGTVMIQLGQEEPVVSMERNGKVVFAKNSDILLGNVRTIRGMDEVNDGDVLDLNTKDLGSVEVYPQSVQHNPNGRLLCVCGDGEYIIYTALKLSNKTFGKALEFVWAADTKMYATRESSSRVKIYKNFKVQQEFRPPFAAEGIFGGALLGLRSNEFIDLYDWDQCRVVRRIDVCPTNVFWSESGELVVLACESSFFVLRYNRELVDKFFEQGVEIGEQGIEGALELEGEVGEAVKAGHFVGDCFIYTNSANRLNYYVGGETMTLAHLNKNQHLLGYLPKENRVYLMDKAHNLTSYELLVSVLVYQTAIVRKDFESAAEALQDVPAEHHNRIAHFLESQDLREMALEVTSDPDHKFELAMQCKRLDLAKDILLASEGGEEGKWKTLGDAALDEHFDLDLARECFWQAQDFGGLLLLHTSLGDREGVRKLSGLAAEHGRNNIAFLCLYLLHDVDGCIDLLARTERIPEAAFMTRTFAPRRISEVLQLWKADLSKVSKTAAESLADPAEYGDRFHDLQLGVDTERWVRHNQRVEPAAAFPHASQSFFADLLEEMRAGNLEVPPQTAEEEAASSAAQGPSAEELAAAAAEQARVEAERAAQEQARLEQEAMAQANAELQEQARQRAAAKAAQQQADDLAAATAAAEQARQEEAQRQAEAEAAARAEQERQAAEAAAAEAEEKRKAAEEAAARAEQERQAAEAAAAAEAARLEAERVAKAQAEADAAIGDLGGDDDGDMMGDMGGFGGVADLGLGGGDDLGLDGVPSLDELNNALEDLEGDDDWGAY